MTTPPRRIVEVARECFDAMDTAAPGSELELQIIRQTMERLIREAAKVIRRECSGCEGTGYADEESECEYCGRPMRAILSHFGLEDGDAC